MSNANRRGFLLKTIAAAGAVGSTGCISSGGGDGGGSSADSDLNTTRVNRVDEFLSNNDARLYDGEIADRTGKSEVTVRVGAGDSGLGFDPPALRAEKNTEILWKWTGKGGGHNVVATDDSDFSGFGDEAVIDEAGHRLSHMFEQSGVGLYVCVPHSTLGMVGTFIIQ